MSRRIAVRGVIWLDGKLLCVQHKAYGGSDRPAFWCLPGGTVEDDETLIDALQREILEETNVEPVIGNLLYVQQFHDNNKEHLEFIFHATNSADFTHIDLSHASHAEEEIEILDFVDPKTVNILPKFLTTEPIGQQISEACPAKVFSYL